MNKLSTKMHVTAQHGFAHGSGYPKRIETDAVYFLNSSILRYVSYSWGPFIKFHKLRRHKRQAQRQKKTAISVMIFTKQCCQKTVKKSRLLSMYVVL